MHRPGRSLAVASKVTDAALRAVAPRRLRLVDYCRDRSPTCAFALAVRDHIVSRTLFAQTQISALSEQMLSGEMALRSGSEVWRDLAEICDREAADVATLPTASPNGSTIASSSRRACDDTALLSFAQELCHVRQRRADVLPILVKLATAASERHSVRRAAGNAREATDKDGTGIALEERYSTWMHHFLLNRIIAHLVVDDFLQIVPTATTDGVSTSPVIDPACDVYSLVEATAVDVCEACASALGASPIIDVVSTSMPPPNCAVPAQIQYAVMELLKNACVATVERGNIEANVVVSISYREVPMDVHSEKLVCIDVTDAAGGIPPELLRNIWQFGWSSRSHLDRRMAGCGVGLPLARVYASLFGGQLFVHPRIADDRLFGSVFSLRLPWGELETTC